MFIDIIAVLLGVAAITSAVLAVTRANPIHGALALMGFFLALSGLYTILAAPFLAALQVLIYVGAILVLFLFAIMLLDLKAVPPGAEPPRPGALLGAVALAVALAVPLAIGGIALTGWNGRATYRAEHTLGGASVPRIVVPDRVVAEDVIFHAETLGAAVVRAVAPDGTTYDLPLGRRQPVRVEAPDQPLPFVTEDSLEIPPAGLATGTWEVRVDPSATQITNLWLEVRGRFVWRPVAADFGSTPWVGLRVLAEQPAGVEIVSILLLVAAVAAIAIAGPDARRSAVPPAPTERSEGGTRPTGWSSEPEGTLTAGEVHA